jgi:hypothetical protein
MSVLADLMRDAVPLDTGVIKGMPMSRKKQLLVEVVGKAVQYTHNGSNFEITIPAKGTTVSSAFILNVVADDMIQLVTRPSDHAPAMSIWIALDAISAIYVENYTPAPYPP